jgi:hypothetical protein
VTTDLERLSKALHKDTPEKLLEEKIESRQQEIIDALEKGEDFVLDNDRGIVIKKAS